MISLFAHAREWRKARRQARQHLDVIEATREKGLWPPRLDGPPELEGKTVFLVRYDRFGDMMLTLPFLARLRAAGCQFEVYTESASARDLLVDAGVRVTCDIDELRGGRPDLVLLPKPCRNFRAPRHPERWRRIEGLLESFPETPFVVPSVYPNEAMSRFVGVYGANPFAPCDALTFLERFADGLGLPTSGRDLLASYRPEDSPRGIALNLTAGTGDPEDRRYIPTELWARFVERFRNESDERLSFVLLPEDESRRREVESHRFRERFDDVAVESPATIVDTAHWLAERRLLVSPDTGLCHLARALDVPLAAAVPAKLLPYWYPPSPRQATVPTKFGRDLDVERLVQAALRLLARR